MTQSSVLPENKPITEISDNELASKRTEACTRMQTLIELHRAKNNGRFDELEIEVKLIDHEFKRRHNLEMSGVTPSPHPV
jgi:hypothetical protein